MSKRIRDFQSSGNFDTLVFHITNTVNQIHNSPVRLNYRKTHGGSELVNYFNSLFNKNLWHLNFRIGEITVNYCQFQQSYMKKHIYIYNAK